jgi:hypothetical protein
VRDLAGQELSLPSWDRAVAEDWLGKWAMNLMLRLDAEIPPCGAASRGRCSGAGGGRRVEVGGFAALRGVVGCAHSARFTDLTAAGESVHAPVRVGMEAGWSTASAHVS